MKHSVLLRSSLLAVALGAALSAQAVAIHITSSGTGANVGPNYNQTENVLAQVGGYGPLATLDLSTVVTAPPLLGTGMYAGAGGTLNFTYSLNSLDTVGPAQSASGTWTATGGTGTYLNATGSGTLAITLNLAFVPDATGTVFAGDVQAVPEPASMAALAVGAAALLRRRKKA